jgi:hypothetical protein
LVSAVLQVNPLIQNASAGDGGPATAAQCFPHSNQTWSVATDRVGNV